MTIDLIPLEDTIVPDTLITPEQLAVKVAATRPAFVPLDGKVRYCRIALRLGGVCCYAMCVRFSHHLPSSPVPSSPLLHWNSMKSHGLFD